MLCDIYFVHCALFELPSMKICQRIIIRLWATAAIFLAPLFSALSQEPDFQMLGRARGHLYYLASDSLKGRNTPSAELDKAADYIAAEFHKYGVKPINGSYFHHYTLLRTNLDEKLVLRFKTSKSEQTFIPKDDYIPLENTGAGNIKNAGLVFAGFGMDLPELHYNDYAGIDVRGKIVVIFRGVPHFADSVFSDTSYRRKLWNYARYSVKARTALKRGATACLIINIGLQSGIVSPRPSGFPWPALYPKMPVSALPLQIAKATPDTLIPMISIGENVINSLFGSIDALATIKERIENSGKPFSFSIDSVTASEFSITTILESIPAKNVVGIIEGVEKPSEHIAVGAHYDHIGASAFPSSGKDFIYNGADDNASGTTGLLLLAEKFAVAQPPKHSIVFIAFSGEERGLLGSKAYCNNPSLPLSGCKAMFNMDMIGRNSDDSVSLGGSTRCKELADIAEEENKKLDEPFKISYNIENFFFRSDQASFAMRKIPVLFFFSGEHSDYHGLDDEADKIKFSKLVRITELCGKCVWRIADSLTELQFTPQKGDELLPIE